MTDAHTQTFPREWMDFNWIMEQQELTGMGDADLMVVNSVVLAVGHCLNEGNTLLLRNVEAGPKSGNYPTIKPADLLLVLSEPDLLRVARQYAFHTLQQSSVDITLQFLSALTQSQED